MTAATITEPITGFGELNLNSDLLDNLTRIGYLNPSPIQAELIPHALAGKDVVGQAQTGTGKTAAFSLPFLNMWRDDDSPGPQALVLAPTRELCVQVAEEVKRLTPFPECRTVAVYGGAKMQSQLNALKRGCSIVVGTPGRLIDHLRRGSLKLDHISYAVLDEADRMLDAGFRPDIERILKRCPKSRQTLLMSATIPKTMERLVHRYMVDPVRINLAPTVLTVDRIRQTYLSVDEERKFELLVRVLLRERPRQCIIFCQRKRWADRLQRDLSRVFKGSEVIHGDLQQRQRERLMAAFRAGRLRCLIATDVVSRGIDVKGISHIVNYDLPEDIENYVHRIGRTGRMGKDGIAISFVTPEQGKLLTSIEMTTNRLIDTDQIPGFTGVAERPEPEDDGEEAPPPQPVFGKFRRRYSNRL